jgi:hypothetical protein
MIIVPYQPSHLKELILQPHQQYLQTYLGNPKYAEDLLAHGPCWTGMDANGFIYGCMGFWEFWPGRAIAWALFHQNVGKRLLTVHKAVQRHINESKYHRIEVTIDPTFEESVRWVETLGFTFEGRLNQYTPDKRDMDMYALIRDDEGNRVTI